MGRGFDSRRERHIPMEKILATSVMIGNKAVLIQGDSGSGKSFLAMRLIYAYGAKLISDDVTLLNKHSDELYANPVDEIKGQIEVRGVGILRVPCVENIKVACVIRLNEIIPDRMPMDSIVSILGCKVPLFTFDAHFMYNDIQVMSALHYLEQKDKIC